MVTSNSLPIALADATAEGPQYLTAAEFPGVAGLRGASAGLFEAVVRGAGESGWQ